MAISEKEAVASLRVLVCMAKADGTLHEEEKKALEAALKGIPLPKGSSLKNLLDEDVNLDGLLSQLTSQEARDETFQSAFGMAYADGDCSAEEKKLLDVLREKLGVAEQKVSMTRRIFGEAKDTFLPSNIQAVTDPKKRAAEIREDVLKYSILSGVLGAFPVPGLAIATDLAVVGVQIKMIRDIGQYWGHKVDKTAAKTLLGGLGVGTGARIAVSNLAKFVPGWGIAFGATTSFATTWALGKIADKYFEKGMKVDVKDLQKEFRAAEKEGKKAYEQNKATIETKSKQNEPKLKALGEDLKAGKITQEEYDRQVSDLI